MYFRHFKTFDLPEWFVHFAIMRQKQYTQAFVAKTVYEKRQTQRLSLVNGFREQQMVTAYDKRGKSCNHLIDNS